MEVMVAIGILGIVSTVAMPATSAFMSQYQLRSTTDQLAFEIGRARTQAIAQHVFVRVRVSGNSWVRERSTDGVTYVAAAAETPLPNGITATATGFPTFNRAGLSTTSTTIVLQGAHGSHTINSNIVGFVTAS
jgi:Tfp pilus assembly protein FimT